MSEPIGGPVPRRLALIGYDPPAYFVCFTRALARQGFEIFWVTSLPSARLQLTRELEVPAEHVLDTTFRADEALPLHECRAQLAQLETPAGPRINDLILMDRLLRLKPYPFAVRYLHHLQLVLTRFLTRHRVTLVTSGRDSALQLMSMLVCRSLGTPWVVPTRLRIPQDLYAFSPIHLMTDLVRWRTVTDEDRVWAESFVTNFDDPANRPALKLAARGVGDALRLLPLHLRLFWRALTDGLVNAGNDYTRYTVPALIAMYLRRRRNLLTYRWRPPYATAGEGPFCLYGLHTQPESSIDVAGSFFSDQVALITFIARALPATHELYVKIHPTDVDGKPRSFYARIAAIPGVRLIDHAVPSRDLIRRASIVFSLTGTMAYEAALLGKPVVLFSRVFFDALPAVHLCTAPPDLPALVDALLRGDTGQPDLRARSIEVMADLRSRSFEGEVNRMYGSSPSALSDNDLRGLVAAYEQLHAVLVERRSPTAPLARHV